MNALYLAKKLADEAEDRWIAYHGATGVDADKERAQEAEHSMFKWATLAQAEAAERQAAAMERIAAHLEGGYIVVATMDEAAGIEMMRERDTVNAAIRDGAAAGLEDDDQNAEVAKVAEFNKRWGFEQ